jgi:hypothetical protein
MSLTFEEAVFNNVLATIKSYEGVLYYTCSTWKEDD